jgi:hypothetical protein
MKQLGPPGKMKIPQEWGFNKFNRARGMLVVLG